MTGTKQIQPSSIASQNGAVLVTVGFVPTPIGTGNWPAFDLLHRVIKSGFKRAGVQFRSLAGFPTSVFVFAIFEVSDRAAALQALRETLADLGILERCGIAYFCRAEEFWRPVAGIPFRYELALSVQSIEAAQQELARANAFGAALLNALQDLVRQGKTEL